MITIAADVKAKLDLLSCEEVAERLGIEVRRHRALCFMHDDHHPSLSFYGDKGAVCGLFLPRQENARLGLFFFFLQEAKWESPLRKTFKAHGGLFQGFHFGKLDAMELL